MAGLIKVNSVFNLGNNFYRIGVENSDTIFAGETFCDNAGHSYRVVSIETATRATIKDDLLPGPLKGTPVEGTGCTYLATAYLKLSQAPLASPAWDEIIRTDNRILDSVIATVSGLTEHELTVDQLEALQGTSGIPSNANRYVTDSDSRFDLELTTDLFDALQGTEGIPSSSNKFVTDSDSRLGTSSLTSDQLDALQGTAGSPSDSNRFVTNSDTRNSNARTPVIHASTHEQGGGDALPSIPTTGEKSALVGTSGAPGSGNKYVTDADTRNTNARAPAGTASGQLSGTYPSPNVIGVRETSGPTNLTLGSVADGQYLRRSGSTVVGASVGSGTSVMVWGSVNIGGSADTRAIPPGWSDSLTSTGSTRQFVIPRSGTFRNMYVRHNAASGNGEAVSYHLRVNGVNSALVTSLVTNAIGTASNLVNSVSVSVGDLIGVVAVKANSIGNGSQEVVISIEFV